MGHIEKGKQVVEHAAGQVALLEAGKDFLVAGVAQGDGIEIVSLHELVEDVGADDHSLGDVYGEALALELGVALDHRTHEGEAAPLASERTVADAGKIAVLIEAVFLVDGHDAGILHAPVLYDEVEYQVARLVHVLVVVYVDLTQNGGRREHGPRVEEPREVVV